MVRIQTPVASDRAVPACRRALQVVSPAAVGRLSDSAGLEASRVEAHPLGQRQDLRLDLLLDLRPDLSARQPSPVTSDLPEASGHPVVLAEALDRAVSAAAARAIRF